MTMRRELLPYKERCIVCGKQTNVTDAETKEHLCSDDCWLRWPARVIDHTSIVRGEVKGYYVTNDPDKLIVGGIRHVKV